MVHTGAVNTPEALTASSYHHGDLPHVLRAAAVAVILDKGVNSFSLREVARRAGVSHAAPGYHFGDVRGLLTSVATEGFETLHAEIKRAGAGIDEPIERLKAIGRGYVRVAVEYPAHCELMFRDDVIDPNNPDLALAGTAAFGVLESTVADIATRYNPALPVTDAARLCWSSMQGLVQLHSKFRHMDIGLGNEPRSLDEHAEHFTQLIVDGLLAMRADHPKTAVT